MACEPKNTPAPVKRTGPIGAYRTEGGGFASFDASGATFRINQAQAKDLGLKIGDDQ